MDQADDNSLTALLTKREQVRFREIVNTCTERRAEKRIQRTAWILSHVLRKTLCEHVKRLCPAGWLNEQCITKHWFQCVRTCPYSWATGRNSTWRVLLVCVRFLQWVATWSSHWAQIRKNRCEIYKKCRPFVLSNILTVALSVGLPVEISNPVPARHAYHFNHSVSLNAFASKAATSAMIVRHSNNDL